jgi:alkaline phosphatase D
LSRGKTGTRPSGAGGQMTVTLRDRADVALWSTTLDPKPV